MTAKLIAGLLWAAGGVAGVAGLLATWGAGVLPVLFWVALIGYSALMSAKNVAEHAVSKRQAVGRG